MRSYSFFAFSSLISVSEQKELLICMIGAKTNAAKEVTPRVINTNFLFRSFFSRLSRKMLEKNPNKKKCQKKLLAHCLVIYFLKLLRFGSVVFLEQCFRNSILSLRHQMQIFSKLFLEFQFRIYSPLYKKLFFLFLLIQFWLFDPSISFDKFVSCKFC